MTGEDGSEAPGFGGEGGRGDRRSGYVVLIGPPNAGKSALMNALVGEKLAAVTPKAQTTWRGLAGIRTAEGVQMIILDSPGVLQETDVLQRAFTLGIHRALEDADVVMVVVDPSRPPGSRRTELLRRRMEGVGKPVICAVNKVDVASEDRVTEEEAWAREELDAPAVRVSAVTGEGLEDLVSLVAGRLPQGPFLYPEEDVATEPVRVFVKEIVREVVFEHFHQEVPYAVMPVIEEFRDEPQRTYIAVTLYVERESQKQIVVGKGGAAIRSLGTEARRRIESFLETPVYLDLWVKVLPNWRKKASHVRRFGFDVPEDEPSSSHPETSSSSNTGGRS